MADGVGYRRVSPRSGQRGRPRKLTPPSDEARWAFQTRETAFGLHSTFAACVSRSEMWAAGAACVTSRLGLMPNGCCLGLKINRVCQNKAHLCPRASPQSKNHLTVYAQFVSFCKKLTRHFICFRAARLSEASQCFRRVNPLLMCVLATGPA